MSLVWAILGGLLIALVAAVCIVFFVVRPIMIKRVRSGAEGLNRELHGRAPILQGAASCEGTTDSRSAAVKGLGALAVTDAALVFVAGSTGTPLIVARESITSIDVTADLRAEGAKKARAVKPTLSVTWQLPDKPEVAATFVVDQPQQWAAELQSAGTPR